MASPELTTLVGLWTPLSHTASLPFGTGTIAFANPERLAIGFSRNALIASAVYPQTDSDDKFLFPLQPVDVVWVWWQKHGPIVGLPWHFTNFGGGASSIVIMEILRTGREK